MPGQEIGTAAKMFRVISWFDRVFAARRRLAYVTDMITELDLGADGLSCAKLREDGVRISYTPDKIGSMLAEREEARARYVEERDRLAAMVADARRVIARARDRDDGMLAPQFAYLIALLDGMDAEHAARSVGATRWQAKGYQRQVAAAVFDSDPARFPPTMEERDDGRGFGYWAFAHGGDAPKNTR